MWFVYLDESKEDNKFYVYSALIVDSEKWNDAFEHLKDMRRTLKKHTGIHISEELHAWKFASGKGAIGSRPIFKIERADIFRWILQQAAQSDLFRVMSSCNSNEKYAFERLMNRLNRTAVQKNKRLILISDQGQEAQFTKRIRRMRVYNPIPSNRGVWKDTGEGAKSITLDRFLEDPFFKDSKTSYFIQLVDFVAYVLLRSERPTARRTALGYDTMYQELDPILIKACAPQDHRKLGIIR